MEEKIVITSENGLFVIEITDKVTIHVHEGCIEDFDIPDCMKTLQAAQDALDSFTREAKNKVADEPLTATKVIMELEED